jgi:Flp pilus assembly protein TadG
MSERMRSSAARKRSSNGNVILESVFTLLPTFAFIFAFTDFGLMMFRWSTLQNALREGTRYAVTFQTQAGLGQDASVASVVQQYALGFVKTSDSPQHIFVNYYAPTALTTPIASGGNVPGNLVDVSIRNLSFGWLAPLSGSYGGAVPFFRSTTPITFNLESADILGGFPIGVTNVTR